MSHYPNKEFSGSKPSLRDYKDEAVQIEPLDPSKASEIMRQRILDKLKSESQSR